jgi:chitinase
VLKKCPRQLAAWLLPWLLACLLPVSARADVWVTGYFYPSTSNPGNKSMPVSNIDFTTITHVIYFALEPTNNGSIPYWGFAPASTGKQVVTAAHAAGKKAIICLGGSGSGPGFEIAAASTNLNLFLTNIVNFVSSNSYDGVDLDWEPINTTDYTAYSNMVVGLRAALNNFSSYKMLTMAGAAVDNGQMSIYPFTVGLQTNFDQINMMSYSMSGSWPGWVTWYTDPIYDGGIHFASVPTELMPSIRGAVSNYISAGVQPGKLGVGIPYYGSLWQRTNNNANGPTGSLQSWASTNTPAVSGPNYSTIMASYYNSNLYHWDNVAQAAYLSLTNNGGEFLSYDDPRACQATLSFARNLGLGGVMIWNLDYEYIATAPAGTNQTPLTAALHQALATPQISTIQTDGTNVSVSFTSAPLALYDVQWSSDLSLGSWNMLTNNMAGTGSNVQNIQITDPTPATLPVRFYRIQTP